MTECYAIKNKNAKKEIRESLKELLGLNKE